jgi:nucleoside-diphosphate-sugar epimerase
MILYNGASGGLGRHMPAALIGHGKSGRVLRSRIYDRAGLRSELAELGGPDEVALIHLAAMVSVPACEADPVGAQAVNVDGALAVCTEVIDWAERSGVRARLVYVSTGHVYARQVVGARVAESDPLEPRSVYALSKLHAETELTALAEARGVPLVVARVFGLAGPGQPAQYVLPGLIRRVLDGDIDGIPGLEHVRDYLDTRDVCEDLLYLAEMRLRVGSTITNVCSGEGVSVRSLMSLVAEVADAEVTPSDVQQVEAVPGRADDVPWIVGDPRRFVELTGTQPRRRDLRITVRDAVAAVKGRRA